MKIYILVSDNVIFHPKPLYRLLQRKGKDVCGVAEVKISRKRKKDNHPTRMQYWGVKGFLILGFYSYFLKLLRFFPLPSFMKSRLSNKSEGSHMQPSRLLWSAYLAYHLRGQARFPFKPLAAIQRAQGRRVRSMASHAYRTVPYYREAMTRLGLGPDDFRTVDDLTKLPVIEREQLQRDPEYFVSTAQPLTRYLKLQSGGSSGMPCTVYHAAAAIFQNAAHAERECSMITALIGRSVGYGETVFASSLGTDRRVQEFAWRRGFFPAGMQIHRQYLSLTDAPEKNVSLLNTLQPDVIHGFGSYLETLFSYLCTTGQFFHHPQAITYSSDGMFNTTRRFIKETLGIPLVSTYEAIEAFKIGFECLYGRGLHLNIDLYPVRIVNARGESLPDGENGDVAVLNLVNRATLLLNYRLGDLSRLLPESCPCGRSLPLLAFPKGRSDVSIRSACVICSGNTRPATPIMAGC